MPSVRCRLATLATALAALAALAPLAGCSDDGAALPPDGATPPAAACGDGIDNDGDGAIDFPADPGCDGSADETEDTAPKPACSDGRDNDGDGATDYPADPGCPIPQADSELDDCPSGPGCPQCSNGADDDLNGKTDYPDDPGCESAADDNEFFATATACGELLAIEQLPPGGAVTGTFNVAASLSQLTTSCGGGGGAPATAYALVLPEPSIVTASTDNPGTTADTVLDIRQGAMCTSPSAHIACHDDISTINRKSRLTVSLPAGTYYLIVQGHDATATGDYALTVERFAGEGASCTMQGDCGPGLVCRVPAGGAGMICTQPVCGDGLDDDNDGAIDYPADPGCTSTTDTTEDDDCPSGPNCPECADGDDNDGDGAADYPLDTSCAAASGSSEACVSSEPIPVITTASVSGTTAGATNDYDPTCNAASGTSPDLLYRVDLPAMTAVSFNVTASYDTVHSLLGASCGGAPIRCSDPPNMTLADLAAGTYYLSVEAYGTAQGPFTIATSGTVAPGGSCEGALYQSGAIACGAGFVCDGPAGARTCRTQCTDGIDNNGDGRTDYPADPGCTAPGDNSEDTVCPGAQCPACADGDDNDGDGATDYPADPSCTAAAGTSESCAGEDDPVGVITAAATTGTLVGAADDHAPSCGGTGGVDKLYALALPPMATLSIDTIGSQLDTVLSLLGSSCAEPSVACDDDNGGPGGTSKLTLSNVPGGQYFVAVDAFSSSTTAAPITLNVTGQIAAGGSCEGALAQSGAIACQAGFACDGPAGARTCRTECSDGIDNNGDGALDYPADPGCTSLGDATEDTVCPGPACPACANGTDDDGDSLSDWPADFGCAAASGASEVFCGIEPDFAGVIAAPTTAGSLAAPVADNDDQSCQSSTGNDVAYALVAPVAASWVISTDGSTVADTILAVRDASCSAQLGCDDDGGAGNLSRIAVALPAGTYAIIVDGFGSNNNGAFVLNAVGTVAPGTVCTSPLFASGVLVCPSGQSCTAGTCQ